MRTGGREWDAETYQRVSAPQHAWGQTVLARLQLTGDETVLDAGCGTGRLTAELLDRLPRGRVIATDLSSNMLTVARRELARFGSRVDYVQANLLDRCLAQAVDVVFSTATFHWVLDHPRLFRQLYDSLKPGGLLEAQCGGSGNLTRTHERATALFAVPPFVKYASRWSNPWEFPTAKATAVRLHDVGFTDVVTYIESAPTPLDGAEAFEVFARAVVLRPYLELISDEDAKRAFLAEMTREFGDDSPPFVLDYCRLNISARKP